MRNHFSQSELVCPTPNQVGLATGFGEALGRLRLKLNDLTSARRSPSHNVKINGHPRNLYLIVNGSWCTSGTCAFDVVVIDGEFKARLITLALDPEVWSAFCK